MHHTFFRAFLCGVALASIAVRELRAVEDAPIRSDVISANDSEAAISAAKTRGAATALKDIEAGTLRILYYGKPWSVGKPLVDDATGYRIQMLSGCVVTGSFVAEIEAYNSAMREWHAKKNSTSTRR